jgi:penicillin amidase
MLLLLPLLFSLYTFANVDCTPTYDGMGIPHINVKDQNRFYFCFGVQHGVDRAWEMDYFRRTALGRNAEIYGYEHLKSDLMMRLLNLEKKANSLWESFSPEYKDILRAYANGVNAGFTEGKRSQEFLDLEYEPELWKPEHSVLVLLLQSFDQTRKAFYRDYEEQRLKEKWVTQTETLFNEDGLPWENTILKKGEYVTRVDRAQKTSSTTHTPHLWAQFPEIFGKESGSNNWVVDKKKSKTKHALLANDPHLELKTPMFWYWIHLKGPEREVIGATLPGVPVVVSGTNGKVAWGLTNAYINTADAVFIKDLKESDLDQIRPKVYVKLGPIKLPFIFKSFDVLKDGTPILPLEVESKEKIALKWSGFDLTPDAIYPMFNMNGVKSVAEMDQILSSIGVPAWNFVFADGQGDIGFRVVGRAFRHSEKIPYGMQTLTAEEFKNNTYLSSEEQPHVLKPSRGYIYTANNRHWPSDAALYGGRAYSASIRGARIDELLQESQDVESFKRIQCDVKVVDALYFLEKFLKHIDEPLFKNSILEASEDQRWLPIYRRLMDITMEEWKVNEYALFRLLDTISPEQKTELMKFHQRAVGEVQGRTWGEVHRISFAHLSRTGKWSTYKESAGLGDNYTVNPGNGKWNEEKKIYEQNYGASMRMIIEMSERPKIHLALPGANRDYLKQNGTLPWSDWRACRYKTISF